MALHGRPRRSTFVGPRAVKNGGLTGVNAQRFLRADPAAVKDWRTTLARNRDYLLPAAAGCVCAALLSMVSRGEELPVLGRSPLLPVTLAAALLAVPLGIFLRRRSIGAAAPARVTVRRILALAAMGAALALLPIAIDRAMPFPRDLNLPLPGALLFYPAIAVVAETVFHLGPLALLALMAPRGPPAVRLMLPVILVEGNVGAVSVTQLWLFQRYGFTAMIGLRLAFYLVWHIVWGTVRLAILFA